MKTNAIIITDVKIENLEDLQRDVDIMLTARFSWTLDEKVAIAKKYNQIMKEYLEALESRKAIKKLLEN